MCSFNSLPTRTFRDPPCHMEQHIPVIFLDLNSDDMSTPNTDLNDPANSDTRIGVTASLTGHSLAGCNSILPKEHGTMLFTLPFVRNIEVYDTMLYGLLTNYLRKSPYLLIAPPSGCITLQNRLFL